MIDRVTRNKTSEKSSGKGDRERSRERSERSSERSSSSSSKSGGYKGYKRPSAESIKERSNRKSGGFDSIWKNNVPRFMYEKGKNPLRICPPTFQPNEADHHFMQVWVHPRQGSDFSDYLCLKKMLKKPCAFCDAQAAAMKDDDADEVKKFKPSEQWVGWVLARDAEDDPDDAKAFKTSFTQDRNLSALSQSSKGGVVYVADPDNGYDINIIRKGSGLNTEYLISIDRESTPLLESPKAQKKLLDWLNANPINEQLEFKNYEYQEQIIKGVVEDKDEDLDDDEDEDEDTGKKSTKASKRNKRDEEDNDEEDEAKSDRRSSSRSGKKDEDEDEEDTSDEEEDEDEKPSRRSSSRRGKDEDEAEEDEEEETSEDEESDEEEEEDDDKESRRPSSKGRRGKTDDDGDEEEENPRRRTGRR